jgi:hypothetical protein
MNKPKHTQGPWTVEVQHKVLTNVTTKQDTRIPYYEVGSELRRLATVDTGLNDQANAQLIAAAPDMLEALVDAHIQILGMCGQQQFKLKQLSDTILTGIRKARGDK